MPCPILETNLFLTVCEWIKCEEKEALSPAIQQHYPVCCSQQEDTASGGNGGNHRIQVSMACVGG